MSRGTAICWRRGITIVWMVLAALSAVPGHAAGTPAGTLIRNTVTLQYSLNGTPATATASAPPVVVGKVISVLVTSQDSAPIPSNSPDTDKATSFLVTNTGNGTETFSLSRSNSIAGDQFDPGNAAAGAIWLESGAQAGFQASGPNADILYVPGVNDVTLAADASRLAYLLSTIPGGQATGAFGKAALIASSTTPGAAGSPPGRVLGTFNGVQTVVGSGSAQSTGLGSYLVAGVSIGLAKSVSAVRDPNGGTRVMSGAVLTYRLVLTVVGSGIASGVAVNDPLPSALAYVPGSITVDGVARTDAADADDASFAAGAVLANFGNVAAPATRVIEFKATVN
jgi:uncharacterized repeat protein (TIGR01451 family)